MNVFYNRKGLGDVLLVQLMPTKEAAISVTTKGDITLLDHAKTEEWIGINIQNASTYMKIEGNGRIELTTDLVDQIQTALKQNGVDRVLEVDLSPKFVVGHVIAKEKHPNADKLSVCQVDVGEEVLQIVCGAPNVAAGQKVVVAKVGAVMPSGMEIRDAELRGIASSGMICSAKELDLPNAPAEKGILVLSDDAKVGSSFSQ